jgi:hypothetical protein
MPFRIEAEPAFERIRITTEGPLGPSEFKAMTRAGLAAALAANVHRVLVDHRAMVPAVGNVDIHDLPEMFDRIGVPSDLRIATLIPIEHRAIFDFFQALAWNRGDHHFRNFEDEAQASLWLQGN